MEVWFDSLSVIWALVVCLVRVEVVVVWRFVVCVLCLFKFLLVLCIITLTVPWAFVGFEKFGFEVWVFVGFCGVCFGFCGVCFRGLAWRGLVVFTFSRQFCGG